MHSTVCVKVRESIQNLKKVYGITLFNVVHEMRESFVMYFKSALSPLLIWSLGLFGNPVKALTVWAEPKQMQLGGSGTHN